MICFTMVLDQNPGATDRYEREDLIVANRTGGRKVKEAFSRAWKAGTLATFTTPLEFRDDEKIGDLRKPSVEEFEERARNYRPSDIARSHFTSVGGGLATLADAERTDLMALVRKTVLGPNGEGKAAAQASRIILTGGSCGWPFMKRLVSEVLGVAPDKIFVPEQPMRVIGEGLAIYPALREVYRRKGEQVNTDLPALKNELGRTPRQNVGGDLGTILK